jgi:hypothetical protein
VIEQFELSQLAVGGSLKVLNFLDLVCIQLWEVFAAANGFVLAVAEARSTVIEIGAPLCAMSHSDTEAVRILCHTLTTNTCKSHSVKASRCMLILCVKVCSLMVQGLRVLWQLDILVAEVCKLW